MIVLHIEHPVRDFAAWKNAFDADPIDRKKSGVRTYRVSRPVDDPGYVIVDLEFDTKAQAEATLKSLRDLWARVEGTLIERASTRILDVVEVRAV